MSSPFPGMDPYLEGELWTSFHAQMAAEISRQLGPKVAPRYVALTQRSYAEEVPHFFVEIRDTRRRLLVTAIEVLSPTNKRGQGRKDYLEKREKLLRSTVHLLEIDLLRQGRRLPMRESLPPAPYFVLLSRPSRRPITEIWPAGLEQSLPTVPVPLLSADPDVALNLQEAFTTVFNICRYDLLIDYRQPPDVPLSAELRRTAKALLRVARKKK